MTQATPLGVTAVILPELDLDEQIALCRETGLTHYSLRPREIPQAQRGQAYSYWGNHKFDLTPPGLAKGGQEIRAKLEAAGLVSFGTNPAATSDADEKTHELNLRGAAAVGAGRVRVNPQPYPKEPFDYEALLARVVGQYGRLVEMARPLRLKIVFETHSRTLAAGPGLALNICRHFDPRDLGVIFDLPNFAREGAVQPELGVAVLGRWIDHCHVGGCRRVGRGVDEQGFAKIDFEFCALAEGDLHLTTWLGALVRAGVRVPLILEDFREAVPSWRRVREGAEALAKALAAAEV